MKYLHEILWYLSWPVVIVISWQAVKWALNKFEKANRENAESEEFYDI